jgi:hypothetical protein
MNELTSFNPRPRAGGDKTANVQRFLAGFSSFNPRPRAGGDLATRSTLISVANCFNPRPRAGGDSLRGSNARS